MNSNTVNMQPAVSLCHRTDAIVNHDGQTDEPLLTSVKATRSTAPGLLFRWTWALTSKGLPPYSYCCHCSILVYQAILIQDTPFMLTSSMITEPLNFHPNTMTDFYKLSGLNRVSLPSKLPTFRVWNR